MRVPGIGLSLPNDSNLLFEPVNAPRPKTLDIYVYKCAPWMKLVQ